MQIDWLLETLESWIFSSLPTRSNHRGCSIKKGVLINFSKFTGKHLCQRSLFNKAFIKVIEATLLKRDPGTGVFLWILQNFKEQLFSRTPPDECFWTFSGAWQVKHFLTNLFQKLDPPLIAVIIVYSNFLILLYIKRENILSTFFGLFSRFVSF